MNVKQLRETIANLDDDLQIRVRCLSSYGDVNRSDITLVTSQAANRTLVISAGERSIEHIKTLESLFFEEDVNNNEDIR